MLAIVALRNWYKLQRLSFFRDRHLKPRLIRAHGAPRALHRARYDDGSSPRCTRTASVDPLRFSVSRMVAPGAAFASAVSRSFSPEIGAPSAATITSPGWILACAAGLPGATCCTSAPSTAGVVLVLPFPKPPGAKGEVCAPAVSTAP